MSILGNYIDKVEEQELSNNRGFTLPAVIREDRESISMKKAMVCLCILLLLLLPGDYRYYCCIWE